MRLLFVHHHFGEFGGAEAYIQLAASTLRQRDHTSALLYTTATGRNEQSWRECFSALFRLPSSGNTEFVEAVLEDFRPDIVFVHNWTDLQALGALIDSGVPVVRAVHDHALYCMRGYKYNPLTRKPCHRAASAYCVFPCLASLARNRGPGLPFKWASYSEKRKEIALNRRCAAFVVYSEYQKQQLVSNGFAADNIELCVPMRTWGNEGLVSSFSPRNLILSAGQVIRGKGIDVLLRALAKVRSPFEAMILGDGHHRPNCERLSRSLGLGDKVHFQGYVPPALVREFYLDASVFVMSSLWPEPFGLAGPEAMRYGLPVVAFDAGAISEWLRDGQNGFLVPWKDTTRFAARLDELLNNKVLARQMGEGGREWTKRYESGRALAGLERLFERLTHRGATAKHSAPGLAPLQQNQFPTYD